MRTTSRLGSTGAAALLLGGLLTGCATTLTATGNGGFPVEATRATALPADFPRTRVPLISGTVIAATGDAAQGWTVAIAPARGQGLAEATNRLAAAGYLTRALRPGPALLTGPEYEVRLTSLAGTIVYVVRRT
ncbi:hypothetical protein ACPPVW_07205 [Leifsonia sp. McL0607]|uniref:hypothetical protein n=1 Tax=Leifsonia sp. McL0607 TaxID=3415672 RepID=UPI003CEE0C9B